MEAGDTKVKFTVDAEEASEAMKSLKEQADDLTASINKFAESLGRLSAGLLAVKFATQTDTQ